MAFIFVLPEVCWSYERDQAFEGEIHRHLGSIAPGAVDYFRKATQAMDQGQTEIATENFARVLEYAPDFVPALRRMSYVVKDKEEALRFARKAYSLDYDYHNTEALVRALLMQETDNSHEIIRYLKVLMEQAPDDVGAQSTICQASVHIVQPETLRMAVANLKRVAPETVVTHYCAGIEAAFDKRWGEAEQEILKAQALGLPEETAATLLEKSGIRSNARLWRWLIYSGYGMVAWAAGLVLLLVAGMFLSQLTLFTIEKGSNRVQSNERGGMYLMRRLYAAILGLTSVYFYVSIPVVILLVIAAGGGVIYGFLMLGRIPIKLTLIILVFVCVTVFGIFKSLFIRVQDQDPGLRLNEADAPSLFNALREVAARISAPMVDSVFIVQHANAAVFERGSFWKRLSGRTEKCLILGLGLLNGLTQVQLKSILAHEFGHISNRDTAGGSIALHVRRSILASAKAMAEGGAATWYNPAWLFMNAFYRIFLRVSQGASRLQEVMADQWAAMAYGCRTFIQGLRHVVRSSVEYDLISRIEINRAIQEKRHLQNLYTLEVPEQWPKGSQDSEDEDETLESNLTPMEKLEAAVSEAMKEQASPFDSHPAPLQRIRWIEALQNVPDTEDDGRPAWELLENAKVLQDLMTNEIDVRVQEYIENN